MSCTDVEKLHPSSPRQRSTCMDVFLLGSVITLFAMLVSGAALGYWLLKDLRARTEMLNVPRAEYIKGVVPPGGEENRGTAYKMENFAYLNINSSELKDENVLWREIKYGNGSSVGSSYVHNANHGTLTLNRAGTYFLYVQLNLTCTGPCANGSLSINFKQYDSLVLSCSVNLHLPKTPSRHLVEKCWTVMPHVEAKSQLLAKMHARVNTKAWKLDLNHSGFGVFLVDGS